MRREQKTVTLSIRMTAAQAELLADAADALDVSRGTLLRRAVDVVLAAEQDAARARVEQIEARQGEIVEELFGRVPGDARELERDHA